jgi:hypothetical protein
MFQVPHHGGSATRPNLDTDGVQTIDTDGKLSDVNAPEPVSGQAADLGKRYQSNFGVILDLAATNIFRCRSAGVPFYNDIRRSFGLAPVTSFTNITHEETEEMPQC